MTAEVIPFRKRTAPEAVERLRREVTRNGHAVAGFRDEMDRLHQEVVELRAACADYHSALGRVDAGGLRDTALDLADTCDTATRKA